MSRNGLALAFLAASVSVLAFSGTAQAQSAIAGVVKDSTGAVLPGVTVEAASPALIEKTRAVVSDEHGEYKIVDLRPGVYVVTFSLPGFTTVKQEGIELPSSFTATINGELRVGAVEETLTVSGAAPVVDVQSTAKSEILPRDVLDSVPTGRTIQGIAQLVSGVKMDQPDVGGTHAMQQTYISGHGMAASQTTVRLDGMMLNSMCGDGQVQFYQNTAIAEEMVYQTTGANADVSGAGISVNVIPKRGGNMFNGSVTAMGATGTWQSDNLTQDLISRGLKATDKIDHNYDVEGGQGGRLIRDKLWFFGSGRRISVNSPIADTFFKDGTQGVDDQYQQSGQLRLTWQISPRNQVTAFADRVSKYRGHAMSAGYDPATAANVWVSPLYGAYEAKWTSTVSNKLMFDAGFSSHQDRRQTIYEPGIVQPYESPGWFQNVNRTDLSLGTQTSAAPNENYTWPTRRYVAGTMTYVTGSHNIKAGVQQDWGSQGFAYDANGDLRQQYQNGVPVSVIVMNTPVRYWANLNWDLGAFAQDSWTRKRMTLNYGARLEYWRSSVPLETNTPGRFAQNGTFGPQDMPTSTTISPRGGVVYDLFGNAKTAVKFSVGKYEQAGTYGLANTYNPIALSTATLSWTDLNKDDMAQGSVGCVYLTPGCEINFAQLASNFGTIKPGCSLLATSGSIPCGTSQVDPALKRIYTLNYNLGIQHELMPRVSVSANWFHVDYYNLRIRNNVLQTFADYSQQQVISPLDGSAITIYNVSRAKLAQVQYLDTNAPNRKQWYNGFEFGFNARLGHGATLFGGTSTDKTLVQACDEISNPNNLLYCDQTQSGIPWRTQFKLVGTYPLPWGIQLSGSFQSIPGLPLGTAALTGTYANAATTAPTPGAGAVWLITPTTRYAAGCPGACTPGALVDPGMTVASLSVPLLAPGTQFADRINDLDVTVARWFTIPGSRVRLQPEASVFNLLNRSPDYAVRSLNYGTASYLQPASVLQGRYLRLGMQVKW